jgi:hypothetical protein
MLAYLLAWLLTYMARVQSKLPAGKRLGANTAHGNLQYPSHPLLCTMGEHGQSQQVLRTCLQENRSHGLSCSVCL